MASNPSDELPSRLAALERRCRRLQWCVVIAVILPFFVSRFGSTLSITTTSSVVHADELRVKRILIDDGGGWGNQFVIERSKVKNHPKGLSVSYGPNNSGQTHYEGLEAFISPEKVGVVKLKPDGNEMASGFLRYNSVRQRVEVIGKE